jgi:hypothetical protein
MSGLCTAACYSVDRPWVQMQIEKIDRELKDLRGSLADVEQASRDLGRNSALAGFWSTIQVAVGPAELWVSYMSNSTGGWLDSAYGVWKSGVKRLVVDSAAERNEQTHSQMASSLELIAKAPGASELGAPANVFKLQKTLLDFGKAVEKGDEVGGLKALTSATSTIAELAGDKHVKTHFGTASKLIGAAGESWKGVQGFRDTVDIVENIAPMVAGTRAMILSRVRQLTERRERLVQELGGGC